MFMNVDLTLLKSAQRFIQSIVGGYCKVELLDAGQALFNVSPSSIVVTLQKDLGPLILRDLEVGGELSSF